MRTFLVTIVCVCFFWLTPDARGLSNSETGLEEISDRANQEVSSSVEMCQTLEASEDSREAGSTEEAKKDFSLLGTSARGTITTVTTAGKVGYTIAKPPAKVIKFAGRQIGKFLF